MTTLDYLLNRTGEVDGPTSEELRRGRAAVIRTLNCTETDNVVQPRRPVRRKVVLAAMATAAAAAIVIPLAGIIHHGDKADAGRQPSTARVTGSARSDRVSIKLAGYVVVLPAGYRLAAPGAATNCNTGLAPTSGTQVIPPGSLTGCPLKIESVVASVPSGAHRFEVRYTTYTSSGWILRTVVAYGTHASLLTTVYFPARLASGRTLYVTLDATSINLQQASELAQGLTVTPA
jgi:hypothetical protein